MKTNSRDFVLFCKTFTKYQKILGLTGYNIFFRHEPLENAFASITVNQADMIATVRLNSKLEPKDKPFKNVRKSAKHEAIHLLLGRYNYLATAKWNVGSEDIREVEEELVYKICNLID